MGQASAPFVIPGYTRGSTSAGTSQEYDALIYDITIDQRVKGVTINSGQGILARGTVLGIAAEGSITSAKVAGFIGGGSIGSLSFTPVAESGVYTVACTTAATTFAVTAPAGESLGNATAGTAFSAGGIGLTITATGTAFAVGDTFQVTVLVLTGQVNIVNSANIDGSQYADCILCDTVNTANGVVVAEAYVSGSFSRQALVFGGTDTYATVVAGDSKTHEAHLRLNGIFLSDKILYTQTPNV
jgi:hypothetical protein